MRRQRESSRLSDDRPTEWDARFLHAVDLFDEGKAEQAVEELRVMRDSAPDAEQRGLCLAQEALYLGSLRRCAEARRLLDAARRLSPHDREHDLRVKFQDVLLDYIEGNFERVVRKSGSLVRHYQDLLRAPEWSEYYEELTVNRAIALAKTGRHREALPALEQALGLGLGQPDVLYYIGECELHLKHYVEAKQALSNALQLGLDSPSVPFAHQLLGLAEWGLGAHAKGLKELETAEALSEPDSTLRTRVYENLAMMWKYLGRDDEAVRYGRLAARK